MKHKKYIIANNNIIITAIEYYISQINGKK